VLRAEFTTFMGRLCRNLGALISWNPQGLSRPVQEMKKKKVIPVTIRATDILQSCRIYLRNVTGK
jgi:hypothetical protein